MPVTRRAVHVVTAAGHRVAGEGLAPQVGFEPRKTLLRQPTWTHSILIEANLDHARFGLGWPDSHREEGQSRDSPQARAISRTLRTSCSVASRTADAGTETTATVWPLLGQVLRQHHTPVEGESHGFSDEMNATNLRPLAPMRMTPQPGPAFQSVLSRPAVRSR